jgi:hypothetical protein
MSRTESADWNSRANEIIRELIKDGYPDIDQMTILTGTLCMLVARNSKDAEHLKEGIAISKDLIELGAKTWFDLK